MDPSALPSNDLARLCSDSGDTAAWNEFVQRFQRPIALAVLRTARVWGAPSSNLIEDLIQETFLRLCADDCRLLRSFVSREPDSIVGYLKVIASNVTHDHFRSNHSQKRGGLHRRVEHEENDLEFLANLHTPDNPADKAVRMREIDSALQSLMPKPVTERDRNIFWLYYQQGFSAREIAAIPTVQLSVKGVETLIHRTTRLLREVMTQCP